MITQIRSPRHEMQTSDPLSAKRGPQSGRAGAQSSIYKVPRRFDLATVFVVTFAYAAFFGSMRALGAPIEVQAAIIGLLTLVGIVQMIASERYVRFAAIACGCLVLAGLNVVLNMQEQTGPGGLRTSMLCVTIVFGPLLGYCAGVVVAGVFLVSDYTRKGFARALGKRVD